MKTSSKLFLAIACLAIASLNSCEQQIKDDSETGTAAFSVNMAAGEVSKSAALTDSSLIPYKIMISVVDMAGNDVYSDKVIPLYTFGTEYVSENIKIKAGQYKLTKFMVINPSGAVIYAAPVAGSKLAYLTTKPLPYMFNIMPNRVTKVVPEVLSVGDQAPDQFGYTAFGVQIINPLPFWTICVIDNPLSAAPTLITTANLTVSIPNGWRFNFNLKPASNKIVIRGGSEVYDLVVEKEGYLLQKMQVSAKDLQATTQEKPLMLKIPYNALYKVIVLQPGPEKGKDAMVSNLEPEKNFGGHKYFEATFLSESMLTVMRSNRSMIAFNLDTVPRTAQIKKLVLTLWYDLPLPFDVNVFKPDVYPATGIAWYGGVLQQITEGWDEWKVTWNLQPKTTEVNQIFVAPFIRNANVIGIDVTRQFVTETGNIKPNYGMLFRLWPSDKFPGFRFASSDYPEPSMRPKLTIYYTD